MVKLIFAVSLMMLLLTGCAEEDSYNFDVKFSDDLLVYGAVPGNKALEEVDEIYVYKEIKDPHAITSGPRKLNKDMLVYKSDDKSIIQELILCARESNPCGSCGETMGCEVFHVVLADTSQAHS
ncbi:MAG: hypothetical protein HZC51_03910 [Nitrospirae bacterium]|nr:hypothetical protein [Nitrospirota bacterium]